MSSDKDTKSLAMNLIMMQKLCSFIFHKIMGWTIDPFPEEKQYVMIVAPHTSNWDFIVGILGRISNNQKLYFLAKSQLFRFPFNSILNALGGIAVDRAAPHHLVEQVIENFKQNIHFKLVITPEGTRSPVSTWKSGFFYIAKAAKVPIVPVALDFQNKHIIVGKPFQPHPQLEETIQHITKFYQPIKGKHPQELPKA
jgi:1-acyl-sn-glycerol-3-phosphate acyltransferase